MRIIRPGQIPTPPAPEWWVGATLQCPTCGAQAIAEDGDTVANGPGGPAITLHAERHPGGKCWVESPCQTPGCGGTLVTQRTK